MIVIWFRDHISTSGCVRVCLCVVCFCASLHLHKQKCHVSECLFLIWHLKVKWQYTVYSLYAGVCVCVCKRGRGREVEVSGSPVVRLH